MLRGLIELPQKSLLVSLRTFVAPKKNLLVSLPTSVWEKKSAGLASQLGGISLGMHTEGVTSARHPYTCGSIPQHNTLQHLGSMEPVMRGKMGLPKQSHVPSHCLQDPVAWHTTTALPRTWKDMCFKTSFGFPSGIIR